MSGVFRGSCAALVLTGLIGVAAPAFAQGRPHGVPPGLAKQQARQQNSPSRPPDPPPTAPLSGSARFRSFGSWLDDASVMGPGEAWVSLSAQRWASPVFDGATLPVADATVGLTDRLHAFATLPVTRYGYPGTPRVHELGDVMLGGKLVVRSAETSGAGLSLSPALEIIGSQTMIEAGMPRVSLVLPVSFELRQQTGRVYGSGGYFTRGAWFLGGALERSLSDAWIATGALTFMGARGDRVLSDAYDLRHQRVDASGSVAWIASPAIVVFGGMGRTLSAMDADATRYAFSVGVSLNVHRPGNRPPVGH